MDTGRREQKKIEARQNVPAFPSPLSCLKDREVLFTDDSIASAPLQGTMKELGGPHMIRTFLPVTFLFSTVAIAASNPTPTWSKSLVNDLKTKTIGQTFCEGKPAFENRSLCDHLKKNQKSYSAKLKTVVLDGEVLSISDGKITVEFKRTSDPLKFEINRKIIDMGELREPGQLEDALAKVLPRVAAARSLWINSAVAQEPTDYPVPDSSDMSSYAVVYRTSIGIVHDSIRQDYCGAVKSLMVACEQNIDNLPGTLQFSDSLTELKEGRIQNSKNPYLRWLESNPQDFAVSLYYMEWLMKRLEPSQVRARLKVCPAYFSESKGGAEGDVDVCIKKLADTRQEMIKFSKNAGKLRDQILERENRLSEFAGSGNKAAASPATEKSKKSDSVR